MQIALKKISEAVKDELRYSKGTLYKVKINQFIAAFTCTKCFFRIEHMDPENIYLIITKV